MEVKIEISEKEVETIIADYIEGTVLLSYAKGKIIHVRGLSYNGLAAVVTIEDAPIDAAKET